jgi:hypothetical protein
MAWKAQLTPSEKLLLVSLADRANEHGTCFSSMADLTSRTGLSESSVHRARRELEKIGHISIKRRPKTSSLYTVHPCQGDTLTPVTVTPLRVSARHSRPVSLTENARHSDTQNHQEPKLNQATLEASQNRSEFELEEEKRREWARTLIVENGKELTAFLNATEQALKSGADIDHRQTVLRLKALLATGLAPEHRERADRLVSRSAARAPTQASEA